MSLSIADATESVLLLHGDRVAVVTRDKDEGRRLFLDRAWTLTAALASAGGNGKSGDKSSGGGKSGPLCDDLLDAAAGRAAVSAHRRGIGRCVFE
jgi:hypothetical protein